MASETSKTEVKVLEQFLAGGELLPSQLPSPSDWSAEKRLAAAVFSSGMMARDLDWIESEDMDWPYSFLRLCELFALEPEWVRGVVQSWLSSPDPVRRDTLRRAA